MVAAKENINVTRNYYFPKGQFGRRILNHIVEKVGGSVDNISFVRTDEGKEYMNVTFSCNRRDVGSIEKILRLYDIL